MTKVLKGSNTKQKSTTKECTLRDLKQQQFAQTFLDTGKFGILNLCPRFGKTRTAIHIFNQIKPKNILIAYPDNKIKESWKADFKATKFNDKNVVFTTFLSLKKCTETQFDLIVIDEIHLLSEAQIEVLREIIDKHLEFSHLGGHVLGLSGTLSSWTEKVLHQELGLHVIATYSIEEAIRDGVIVDYQITVVQVPLDNVVKKDYKGKQKTEKKAFDDYGWVIERMQRTGGNTMFLRLARMRIIQKSLAKLNKTKELLKRFKDERVLVFCGITNIADSLGIPSHHSKSDVSQSFQEFAEGKGNHMAVVRIGNTGVTYKPLNRVIINYFDSNAENLAQKINRCMGMEYNNPNKKADIYIITSTESVEQAWLKKALEFFDRSKIKYVSS